MRDTSLSLTRGTPERRSHVCACVFVTLDTRARGHVGHTRDTYTRVHMWDALRVNTCVCVHWEGPLDTRVRVSLYTGNSRHMSVGTLETHSRNTCVRVQVRHTRRTRVDMCLCRNTRYTRTHVGRTGDTHVRTHTLETIRDAPTGPRLRSTSVLPREGWWDWVGWTVP